MNNNQWVLGIAALLCAGVFSCELDNPIMEKWWEEPEPEEAFYVPIIKTLPPETLYKTIIETDYIYKAIYEKLPPEVIVEQLPPEVIIEYLPSETIMEHVTDEEIREYIRTLPPENILDYLTKEQIDYLTKEQIETITSQIPPRVIVEYLPPEVVIQQLPPQILLQSISIIDIEYIIFSGDATAYNVNSPTPGGTSLTTQEKATNDDIVNVMAQMLRNQNYMLILHGHANPVTGTAAEAVQLTQISLDRANAVRDRLKSLYTDGVSLDDRITTKGYGGERNVTMTGSSATSSLNRRVEAILFMIATAPASGEN
jgi:hypothetical protein